MLAPTPSMSKNRSSQVGGRVFFFWGGIKKTYIRVFFFGWSKGMTLRGKEKINRSDFFGRAKKDDFDQVGFFFRLILGHFWVDEVMNFRFNQGFDGGRLGSQSFFSLGFW